jgi:hypothetical protein
MKEHLMGALFCALDDLEIRKICLGSIFKNIYVSLCAAFYVPLSDIYVPESKYMRHSLFLRLF